LENGDSSNTVRHIIYGTDIAKDRAKEITLRLGEGIIWAAALSRQPVWVDKAQNHSFHNSRVDTRFGNRTHAMISAPILFEARLFGVVNILNYQSPSKKGIKRKDPPAPSSSGKTVIVGISLAMQEVLRLCLIAGDTNIPVLIYGETGTGKELAAHRWNPPLFISCGRH
jgi:transcriptional regulator with GAF, ATPase, and Fis domain